MKNNWKYRIRCKLTRGAPVFEMLRRENEKKYKQIRFGVLCGTIVIIPAEAKMRWNRRLEQVEKLRSVGSAIFRKQIILK